MATIQTREAAPDRQATRRERVARQYNLQPLHIAVLRNDVGAVKHLIASGTDIEAESRDGLRPLHLAVLMRRATIFHRLLESGASWEEDLQKLQQLARVTSDNLRKRLRNMGYLVDKPKAQRNRKKLQKILRSPLSVLACSHRHQHGLSNVEFLRRGRKVILLKPVVTAHVAVRVNKNTTGFISGAGRPGAHQAACSGWSMRGRHGPHVLDNSLWVEKARTFCKAMDFALRANDLKDTPGQRTTREEDIGREAASHVEIQLGLYWLQQQLQYALNTTDLLRLEELKPLIATLPEGRRRCFIMLDHTPCDPCLEFLELIRLKSGLVILPIPCPIVERSSRRSKKPDGKDQDGQQDDTDLDADIAPDDVMNGPPRSRRSFPAGEATDKNTAGAITGAVPDTTERISVRSSRSRSMSTLPGTPQKQSYVHFVSPARAGGTGAAPRHWRHGKPIPATPAADWAAHVEPTSYMTGRAKTGGGHAGRPPSTGSVSGVSSGRAAAAAEQMQPMGDVPPTSSLRVTLFHAASVGFAEADGGADQAPPGRQQQPGEKPAATPLARAAGKRRMRVEADDVYVDADGEKSPADQLSLSQLGRHFQQRLQLRATGPPRQATPVAVPFSSSPGLSTQSGSARLPGTSYFFASPEAASASAHPSPQAAPSSSVCLRVSPSTPTPAPIQGTTARARHKSKLPGRPYHLSQRDLQLLLQQPTAAPRATEEQQSGLTNTTTTTTGNGHSSSSSSHHHPATAPASTSLPDNTPPTRNITQPSPAPDIQPRSPRPYARPPGPGLRVPIGAYAAALKRARLERKKKQKQKKKKGKVQPPTAAASASAPDTAAARRGANRFPDLGPFVYRG